MPSPTSPITPPPSGAASWDLPWRTKALVAFLGRERGSIATMDAAEIERARTLVAPTRAPFTWVTGRVYSDVLISEEPVTTRDGERIMTRIYRPTLPGPNANLHAPERIPVMLYLHGGGWVLGTPRGYDPLCSFLAHECGIVVVSPNYRLAPEHRAPAAAMDAVDTARWITTEADRLGVDAQSIGIGGDSAGGNLSAVVSQVIRDEGGAHLGYQALIYPAVDATLSHPSMREHANGAVLTRADVDAFLAHYLDDSGVDLRDPRVSPLFATSLVGLPPALVQTADLDPLRDEGIAYAVALREAGVPVRATNYPNVPHGFMSFPGVSRNGAAARRELAHFVGSHAHSGAATSG